MIHYNNITNETLYIIIIIRRYITIYYINILLLITSFAIIS